MQREFKTDERVLALLQGRRLVEPASYSKQWTASRLVDLGEGRTTPLLLLIARAKYGEFDPKTHLVFWIDKDCTNETWDNVGMVDNEVKSRATRKSQFGVPSASREYHRQWREKNKERVREYQKRRYHLMREALHGPGAITGFDADRMGSKLMDIITHDGLKPTVHEEERSGTIADPIFEDPFEPRRRASDKEHA